MHRKRYPFPAKAPSLLILASYMVVMEGMKAASSIPVPLSVSLNILRFHQILRPQESFHAFPLSRPINLTYCYRIIKNNSNAHSAIGKPFAVRFS
jgi:hypothetical protein